MESLNDGFEQGFKSSNKITNKNIKTDAPISDEKNLGNHDKFWCMPLPEGKHYKRFVDFQNDVAVSDIELAASSAMLILIKPVSDVVLNASFTVT